MNGVVYLETTLVESRPDILYANYESSMRQYFCQIVYLLSTFHNVTRCDKYIYEALKVPVPEADVRVIQITTSSLAQSSRMSYILCRMHSIFYKRHCNNRSF